MNHYVSISLTNSKSSVHLHALYSPRTALRTFLPRRDHLVICGQYPVYDCSFGYHGYRGNPLSPTQFGPHWSHSQKWQVKFCGTSKNCYSIRTFRNLFIISGNFRDCWRCITVFSSSFTLITSTDITCYYMIYMPRNFECKIKIYTSTVCCYWFHHQLTVKY
jgi:hypothetical protein